MLVTDFDLAYNPLEFIKAVSLVVKSPPKKSWIYGLADSNFEVLADRTECINLRNFGENIIHTDLANTTLGTLASKLHNIACCLEEQKVANIWLLSVGAQSSSGLLKTGSSTIVAPLITGDHSYYVPDNGMQALNAKGSNCVHIVGDYVVINGNHKQSSLFIGITLVEAE